MKYIQYYLLPTILSVLLSFNAFAGQLQCPKRPILVDLMYWNFTVIIAGADEQGRLIVTLDPNGQNTVSGRVNGHVTSLDIINELNFDAEGNETENTSWTGTILLDDGHNLSFKAKGLVYLRADTVQGMADGSITELDHNDFYSAGIFTFRTDSEQYSYLNNIAAFEREDYAEFSSDFNLGMSLWAALECFEGALEQIDGLF